MKWILGIFSSVVATSVVYAFCGFYVARADATLYNKASKVVYVRDENKNVITMMNDYQGSLKDFALVVPVPVVLEREQIHIGDSKVVDHLDAFSAPRLVEYYDENPCRRYYMEDEVMKVQSASSSPSLERQRKKDLGVSIEATYTVGEYDIVILSAKYSQGLEEWLIQNNYKFPEGAHKALEPYIKQKMKFFVAKVNLKEQSKTGLTYLRPLQFAFDSPKFMLPIRLGMINAKGDQDLIVFTLTRKGRVETTNYMTIKLPSNFDVPIFVKQEFKDFYLAMFETQVKKYNGKAVFTEYFWDMSWCDPCAADPLSTKELGSLGVFWIDANSPQTRFGAPNVLVTRLHLRYNDETFPEDLMFQETTDRANFQGRYVIRHPWNGNPNECNEAKKYLEDLPRRQEELAQSLASYTGWEIELIRKKMNLNLQSVPKTEEKWWKKIWR